MQQKEEFDESKQSAALCLQGFWKKLKKQSNFKSKLLKSRTEIQFILSSIRRCVSTNFEEAQHIFASPQFLGSLSAFLIYLPKDALLGSKSTKARNPRIISSAVLISHFPQSTLVSDDQNLSGEEVRLFNASLRLFRALKSFLRIFEPETPKFTLRSMMHFLNRYRAVVRQYLDDFDEWKKVDSKRIAQSLQLDYTNCFAMFIAAENEDASLTESIHNQLEKIAKALGLLMGESKAELVIEELRAHGRAAHAAALAPAAPTSPSLSRHTDASLDVPLRPTNMTAALSPSSSLPASSLTSPPPQSPTMDEGPRLELAQQRLLDRLSHMSGVANERLVHEMLVDPSFQIVKASSSPRGTDFKYWQRLRRGGPSAAPVGNGGSSGGGGGGGLAGALAPFSAADSIETAADNVRAQWEAILADRLVWSLRWSPIASYDELRPGLVVPCRFSAPGQPPSSGNVFSAHILRTHSADADADANPSSDLPPGDGDRRMGIAFVDVEFVADHVVQLRLPVQCVVLAGEGTTRSSSSSSSSGGGGGGVGRSVPDASVLVDTLAEFCGRVASMIPHRTDLHAKLLAQMDLPLLLQMLHNGAMGVDELRGILRTLFSALQELQAPARAEAMEIWWAEFERHCALCCPQDRAPAAAFPEAVLLIPTYFEYISTCFEDFQRDMVAFYAGAIAAPLQQVGHDFLRARFTHRIKGADVQWKDCIPKAAAWIRALLVPEAALALTVASLSEASASEATNSPPSPRTQTNSPSAVGGSGSGAGGGAGVVGGSEGPDKGGEIEFSARAFSTDTRSLRALIAHALVSLLQTPLRLDSHAAEAAMPETLEWDRGRLAAIRDAVDSICIVAALTMVVRQLLWSRALGVAFTLTADEEDEFQARVGVLLEQPDVALPSLLVEVNRFLCACVDERGRRRTADHEQMQRIIHAAAASSSSISTRGTPTTPQPGAGPIVPKGLGTGTAVDPRDGPHTGAIEGSRISGAGVSVGGGVGGGGATSSSGLALQDTSGVTGRAVVQLVSDWEPKVRDAVMSGLADRNPILQLFSKRVYKLLLRALMGRPLLTRLRAYSLHSKALEKRITELAPKVVKLFQHHAKVFEAVYRDLLREF